jgi:hypothetical protein
MSESKITGTGCAATEHAHSNAAASRTLKEAIEFSVV